MVQIKSKEIETIISGPTKEPDPDATEYEDDITYENDTKDSGGEHD